MKNGEKVDKALGFIMAYGGVDGGHHKQWLLDQVVQLLAGDYYEEWVKLFQHGDDGPNTYEWEKGIAP